MKKYLLIALTVLFFACQSENKTQSNDTDTLHEPIKKEVKSISIQTEPAGSALKNRILGVWTGVSSDNAVFKIEADSIYYFAHEENYKYDLNGDVIKIFYPDYSYTGKLSFIKDTLVMTSPEDGTSKFWKFKD